MARVPRYGIHNNIKYNKKRTLIRFCKVCGKPLEIIGSNKASVKYCEVCKLNKDLESKRKYDKKRPKRNEYLSELKRLGRANGTTKSNNKAGNNSIRSPKENMTEKDWKEMENTVKKLKRETLGGWQEYNDMDEYDEY